MPSLRELLEMRDANIRRYFPDVLANAKEFVAFADVVEPELDAIIHAILNNALNNFVYQLDENGAVRWENMLHLYPGSDDTLEDRRMAILAKIMSGLPYTYRKLEQILDGLCGVGGYKIINDFNTYSLKIYVSLGAKKQRDTVNNMSRYLIPANLALVVDLLYNRHIDMEPYTHEYLERFSHEDIVDEVLE